MKDIVDRITDKNRNMDKGSQLIKLYSVAMVNYRAPLGDKAWDAISKLFDDPALYNGFVMLCGMIAATGFDTKKFEEFIHTD